MPLIPYEGSFTLWGYVESPGYQTIIPQGYVSEVRNGETWIAPLIPELFYGADGSQLQHTWRQDLTSTGEQMILSRVGGKPEVPREQLYWVRLRGAEAEKPAEAPAAPTAALPSKLGLILGGFAVTGIALAYLIHKRS
jgi:hypothetical protein